MPRLLCLLSTLAVVCLMGFACAVFGQTPNPIRVEGGLLSGTTGSDPTVRVFKGIPFAAPPVGDRRWRPPQPAKPWERVRKADRFGPSAMQAHTGPFGPWTKEFIFGNEVSEDCLYLNVWTAAQTAAPIEYNRLAFGFVPEKNCDGSSAGHGLRRSEPVGRLYRLSDADERQRPENVAH